MNHLKINKDIQFDGIYYRSILAVGQGVVAVAENVLFTEVRTWDYSVTENQM